MGVIVPCNVDDCQKPAKTRGFCSAHYANLLRNGAPTAFKVKPTRSELFWAKVDKNGPVPPDRPDLGPCWLWLASLSDKGYGHFGVGGGRSTGAHRWAYENASGQLPLPGFELDHLCRVRRCVNPAHLEPVTHVDNLRRSPITFATLHAAKTHCVEGHPLAGDNVYVSPRGHRSCRTCRRAVGRANYRRKIEGRLKPVGRPRSSNT